MVPQFIKMWSRVFSALCERFWLRGFFFELLAHLRPPEIIIAPPDNFAPSSLV